MYLRRFLHITTLLFAILTLNSCAAVNAPVKAVSSVINATAATATNVVGAGVRTAGAVVGAPLALMQ